MNKLLIVKESTYGQTLQNMHPTYYKFFPQRMQYLLPYLEKKFEIDVLTQAKDSAIIIPTNLGDSYKVVLTDNPYLAKRLIDAQIPFVFDWIDDYSGMIRCELENNPKYRDMIQLEVLIWKEAKHIICQSKDIAEKAPNPIPTTIIPNGASMHLFDHTEKRHFDKFTFVYVGKLGKWYHHAKEMILGMGVFEEILNEAQMMVVGDGELRSQLETIAPKNVYFPGVMTHQQAVSYIKGADVCVFCVDDGSPIAIAEYIMACKPIITIPSKVGSTMLPDGKGVLYASPTADSYGNAYMQMISDRLFRQIKSKQNRERRHLFDWSTLADKYCEVLEANII